MNQFKCRHCDKPAHFYFRESEGGMLCPDHSDLHCAAHVRDMMARSRISNPSERDCPDESASASTASRLLAADAAISSPSVLSPPEAGAPVVTPLPVTAGAALSLDEYWSDFFDRRKATALRVMASKATQVPKSSSDIPNHHQ